MEERKLLPIGSVVRLKDANHSLAIMGFCIVIKEENGPKQYDYVGVPYPEGFMSKNSIVYFNGDKIDKVFFEGFSNEDEKNFKSKLYEVEKTIIKNDALSVDKLSELFKNGEIKYEKY